MRSAAQKDFYLFPRPRKTGRPIWYVQFRDPLTRKMGTAQSSHLTNRTAAEKWAAAEYDRLAEFSRFPDTTLREWAGKFFLEKDCPHVDRLKLEGKSYAERTRKLNRTWLETYILSDPIVDLPVAAIRRPEILAFRDRLVARVGRCRTAQAVMATLRIVLREALYREMTDADPFAGVGQIHYETITRSALSKEAVIALLDRERWDDQLFWEATKTAAATGMRAGEIRALQWGDLRPPIVVVRRNLPGESTEAVAPKWGKPRVCPYSPGLQKLLEPRRGADKAYVFSRGGGPIGYKRWSAAVREAAAAARAAAIEAAGDNDSPDYVEELAHASLHVLRHTLNTALRGQGHNDELLRGAFGWSSADIQEEYTHREGYDYSGLAASIDDFFKGAKDGG